MVGVVVVVVVTVASNNDNKKELIKTLLMSETTKGDHQQTTTTMKNRNGNVPSIHYSQHFLTTNQPTVAGFWGFHILYHHGLII